MQSIFPSWGRTCFYKCPRPVILLGIMLTIIFCLLILIIPVISHFAIPNTSLCLVFTTSSYWHQWLLATQRRGSPCITKQTAEIQQSEHLAALWQHTLFFMLYRFVFSWPVENKAFLVGLLLCNTCFRRHAAVWATLNHSSGRLVCMHCVCNLG